MPVATKAELMPWKEEYSLGIKQMDEQHKVLVRLINDLHQAMVEGKSRDVMARILSQLVDYTKNHFSNEERLLGSYSYPGYATQKVQHDQFTKTAIKFQEEINAGKSVVSVDVMDFLKNWLRNHILSTDQRYSLFLKGHGVS